MKLLLHIGTEKTGSTSLQRWMRGNHDALCAQGVYCAMARGRPDARALAQSAQALADPADRTGIEARSQARQEAIANLDEEFQAARAAGARVFLLSSEHFHSRMKTRASVQWLSGVLGTFFSEIEVLCWLRPQIDMAVSRLSTAARHGHLVTRKPLERLSIQDPYYNYLDLLTRWADVYGQDRMTVVPFKRHPSAVSFLSRKLSLDTGDLNPPQRVNTRLDYRTIALCNYLRNMPEKPLADGPKLRNYLNRISFSEPLTLDRASAEGIQDRFAAINAAVADTWPAIRTEDLLPDYETYPEHGTIDLLDTCDFTQQLAELIAMMSADLALHEAREQFAEARRKLRSDDPQAATPLLKQALETARNAQRAAPDLAAAEGLIGRIEEKLAALQS